jgi:hypothetical protein
LEHRKTLYKKGSLQKDKQIPVNLIILK